MHEETINHLLNAVQSLAEARKKAMSKEAFNSVMLASNFISDAIKELEREDRQRQRC